MLKTSHSPSDEALVATCQSELPYVTKSFEQLVRRHEASVYRTCLRNLLDSGDAEEATQDVFLRVFHHIGKFEGRASFKTWLFRIVANVCSSRYRARRTEAERRDEFASMSQLTSEAGEPMEETLDFGDGPLSQALDALPGADRDLLILRHVSELAFDELSESLQLSLSATKMRLYRAEAKLLDAFNKLQKNEIRK